MSALRRVRHPAHVNRVINEYLDGITLQDLLEQQTARAANDYVI